MEPLPPIETVRHEGRTFYRIDPATINLEAMEEFQKLTDIFAWQVEPGREVEVHTVSADDGVTISTAIARPGDWIECDLGSAGECKTLKEKIARADKNVLPDEVFRQLYQFKEKLEEYFAHHPEEPKDENDAVSDGERRGALYEYVGAPVKACRVPFNFVLHTVWGTDQYVPKGGVIVYNPRSGKPGKPDIHAAVGAHDRHPSQFEKTHGYKGDRKTLSEVHAYVFKADLSPLPGIQFSSKDLQRAYSQVSGLQRGV